MKKFISKIRNKRLKGNVSLLVILILLASSVIALLSISQIQHLITYGNMTFNYFRAFYLAKAGTEFGLTEVYNRENGFQPAKIEHEENKDGSIDFDPIIAKNFLGDDNEYEGAKPYFDIEIKSNFNFIGNDVRYECNKDNKIILEPKSGENPGGGLVLSLFKDDTSGLNNILDPNYVGISSLSDSTLKKIKFDKNPSGDLMFGLFNYDMTNIHVVEGNQVVEGKKLDNDLHEFLENFEGKVEGVRRYLTIKNKGSTPVSFCIIGNNIPYSNYLVTVRGNYADMEVGLKSVVKKEVPAWSLDVLGWNEP